MYRYAKLTAFLLTAVCIAAGMTIACATVPSFTSVQDGDWKLIELRVQPGNIVFDRSKLAEDGFDKVFTIRFDFERISGTGAPNSFFAPYSLTDNQGISIKTIAQTLMAPINEPGGLKEHDFYMYLQNANRWGFEKTDLLLFSKSEDGTEAVMVFRLGAN